MRVPFTVAEFLDVFAELNRRVWPAQLAAYALGLLCVALALQGGRRTSRAVLLLLATAWAFVGVVYHLTFFAPVNPLARLFGAAFVVQAGLFAECAYSDALSFGLRRSRRALVGLALVAFAAVVYPVLGAAFGHAYPRAATFGLTPCPTTIFTFGVLLLAKSRVPPHLLVIPLLWSLVGASAALHLGIREDLGLVAAGALAVALLPWRAGARGAPPAAGDARAWRSSTPGPPVSPRGRRPSARPARAR